MATEHDNPIARYSRRFLIWSFEHDGWWAPNGRGYTKEIAEAGIYDFGEAFDICVKANAYGPIYEAMVPVEQLKGRN